MSAKKRILITSSVGATAVIAGVSPAIASNTNTQSSTVNVPLDPVNPDDQKDPNNPDDQKDPVNPDDQKDPNNPGGQTEPAEPVEPVEPVEPTYATAPSEDIFTLQFVLYSLNDTSLNNYFIINLAKSGFYQKYFENSDKYSNVNVTYVPNSASFTTNTFKVNVTPVEGAIWENTATNNEQRTVTVKIDKAARIPDATVPAKSKNSSFNITVNDTNIKTDADLNNWMKNYFNTKFNLSHFTPETPDYVFKNVNLTYVENSASIANKSFKVKATPTDGHAWSNNTFYKDTFVDPFEMDIWFLNLVTKDKFITLPDRWGINLIMATNFPFKNFHSSHLQWKNISWILEDDFDTYWYNHNPKYYDDLSVKYQHLLFEEGWKDIARYYPVELSGTFEQCEWSWIQRINGGATFNFKVPMKPKAGYYWADGTNGTRMVHLNLFLSADQDAGPGILSDVSDMNYIKTFNQKESAATDGLPVRSWVTNDLIIIGEKLNKPTFEENVKVLENIAKDDLVKSFPNYNIEISDVKSTSWGDPWWIPDTWTYKIKFTSKTNPSYSKTMDGYIFTIN